MLDFLRSRLDFYKLCIIFVFLVLIVLVISEWIIGKSDGTFEEMAEDMIQHETGIDIDLTPLSKE